MAKLRINEGDLLMAFDSGDGMMQWFLDRQTGEVIGLSDDFEFGGGDDDDDDGDDALPDWQKQERALRRSIYEDEDDERYLPIPSLESREGYRIMEDFAQSQDDHHVRGALFNALDRRRPFRSFKDALFEFPEARERWFVYEQDRLREEALAWLKSEEIDAELTRPTPEQP